VSCLPTQVTDHDDWRRNDSLTASAVTMLSASHRFLALPVGPLQIPADSDDLADAPEAEDACTADPDGSVAR
jgi:hypothetical protein